MDRNLGQHIMAQGKELKNLGQQTMAQGNEVKNRWSLTNFCIRVEHSHDYCLQRILQDIDNLYKWLMFWPEGHPLTRLHRQITSQERLPPNHCETNCLMTCDVSKMYRCVLYCIVDILFVLISGNGQNVDKEDC